jgi:hypothetical protein
MQVEISDIDATFFGIDTAEPEEQTANIFNEIKVPDFRVRQKNIGSGMIAVEGPGESRKFFADESGLTKTIDFLDACDGTCEPIHEVIDLHCRFYCDLDDKVASLTRVQFMQKINIMHHYFGTFFKQYYQIEAKILINFYAAFSENPNYNSAHIYIDVIDEDTSQYFITKNGTHQYPFWKKGFGVWVWV